ncbi:MAG: porin, partial [Pseudomonadota bacterium]|nr:porin [Pseudomonadota bacterium]
MYAALVCSSVSAYADDNSDALTVYGRANVGLLYSDIADQDDTEVKSYSSRFGLKGLQSLDNNLEVFYQFEWGVDLAGFDEDDSISDRNQIVGLRGDFGTVMLGRYDTFLKDSQGAIDQF